METNPTELVMLTIRLENYPISNKKSAGNASNRVGNAYKHDGMSQAFRYILSNRI